jgi:hypothetical protein
MKVLIALALLAASSSTTYAQEVSPPAPLAGYVIADDAIAAFYGQFGGATTFGEPISREFLLFGKPTQIFQNAALQVQPDGSVQPMPLADPGVLAGVQLGGLTIPATDGALAFVAPNADQANFAARLPVFLKAAVPDAWNGQPVQFLSTFNAQGGTTVWGLPTSSPKADPNNPSFVYQRFQNGVLFFDASAGTTNPLPLGDYLKSQLTSDSPLLKAAAVTQTDLTDAFVPDAG